MHLTPIKDMLPADLAAEWDYRGTLHVSHPDYDENRLDDVARAMCEWTGQPNGIAAREQIRHFATLNAAKAKRGRPAIGAAPMSPAERQRRARALKLGSIAGELAVARLHIEDVRKALARVIGGTEQDAKLLDALDAIARAEQLLT